MDSLVNPCTWCTFGCVTYVYFNWWLWCDIWCSRKFDFVTWLWTAIQLKRLDGFLSEPLHVVHVRLCYLCLLQLVVMVWYLVFEKVWFCNMALNCYPTKTARWIPYSEPLHVVHVRLCYYRLLFVTCSITLVVYIEILPLSFHICTLTLSIHLFCKIVKP